MWKNVYWTSACHSKNRNLLKCPTIISLEVMVFPHISLLYKHLKWHYGRIFNDIVKCSQCNIFKSILQNNIILTKRKKNVDTRILTAAIPIWELIILFISFGYLFISLIFYNVLIYFFKVFNKPYYFSLTLFFRIEVHSQETLNFVFFHIFKLFLLKLL